MKRISRTIHFPSLDDSKRDNEDFPFFEMRISQIRYSLMFLGFQLNDEFAWKQSPCEYQAQKSAKK